MKLETNWRIYRYHKDHCQSTRHMTAPAKTLCVCVGIKDVGHYKSSHFHKRKENNEKGNYVNFDSNQTEMNIHYLTRIFT